jgi:hypothetical protein
VIRYERLASGDLVAHARVPVGIDDVDLTVPLGPWFPSEPDPAGLAMAPVVALPDPRWSDVVRRAALLAGGYPTVLLLGAADPFLGGQLLVAVSERVEIVIVEGGGADALRATRGLAGRPILSLPLERPDLLAAILADLEVDVHLPVPRWDAEEGSSYARMLRPLGAEARHQLVDVDPRPGLAAANIDHEAPPEAVAAVAAGILAGRLAAGNRRRRAP